MFNIEKITTLSGHDLVVCYGTDYINPFSLLSDIKDELLRLSFHTPIQILFDLYPTNGNSSNRFAKIQFDGENFIRSSFEIVPKQNLDSGILEHQNKKIAYFS